MDHLSPWFAAQPRDQLAEDGIPDVRVVESRARSELQLGLARHQLGPGSAGGPLPPWPVGLRLQPGGMGKKLGDREVGERRVLDVPAEGVVQVEQTLVAHTQHLDRHEGLGDRADAVLRLDGRRRAPGSPVEGSHRAGPDQLTTAHQPGCGRWQPALRLFDRQAVRESPRGGRGDAGHGQAFFATDFLVAVFLTAAFFAVVFLAVVFFAAVFLVAAFFVVFLTTFLRVTGPRARFSANSSAPRSGVMVSGWSSLRKVALVSPSVT